MCEAGSSQKAQPVLRLEADERRKAERKQSLAGKEGRRG